ncbi:MAG TPA: glycoside hydrolase family 2, partial [Planctomycetales bacterium]|nr:glycoside hydrolase family 2 [Planctomycetales bacterium]
MKLPNYVCTAVAATACWFLVGTANAADWKPADGPLMTRWAKDVNPDKCLPEYPRPQMRRGAWLNLNGLWQLAFGKEGEQPPTGKDLPEHILVPFPVESALSGVMKSADRLWYRRSIAIPRDWASQRLLLHFGAVDWEATVWVNGKKLGDHRGGYDAFTFDMTDAVDPKKAEQELIVGVYDPTDGSTQPRGKQVKKPQGIFYTSTTGIWQTVWLEPVNRQGHIESVKIEPNIDKEEVTISVHLSEPLGSKDISIEVRDGAEVVAKASGPDYSYTLKIPKPKLWSPDSPTLYTVHVVVLGMLVATGGDEVESYFGMRKIEVGKDDNGVTRILLNGKPTLLCGPLDQGFWPDGIYTAPTDEALKYDIEITKKLGFNMTRKHVKVEPERWYYWCDKLGLAVLQDMPAGDKGIAPGKPDIVRTPESAKQFELELKRMIDGLYNHPSIITWVVFNEGWGQYDTVRVVEWTKTYDPSRLVDDASGWQDRKVGDLIDMHNYPGPGAPEPDGKRALILGEFGGLGLFIEGHTWEKKIWGYRGVKDRDDLTRKYEKLMEGVYRLNKEKGLSASVYTQLTDVETEGNGLLTYDRATIKPDIARTAAANKGDFSHVAQEMVIVPTSQEKGQVWSFTFEKPAEGWYKSDFKDTEWKKGEGAFGANIPGAPIRTEWKTDDIWLRREVTLPDEAFPEPYLTMFHDEDAEVYFNGVLAAKVKEYNTSYEETPITPEALAVLKPGKKIVMAVHCHQTTGGQYIDFGLTAV